MVRARFGAARTDLAVPLRGGVIAIRPPRRVYVLLYKLCNLVACALCNLVLIDLSVRINLNLTFHYTLL